MRSLVDAFVADLAEIVRQATLEQLELVLKASPVVAPSAPAERPQPRRAERPTTREKVRAKAVKRHSSKPRAVQLTLPVGILEETNGAVGRVTESPHAPPSRAAEPETHPFVLRRNGERVRRLK